MEVTEMKETVKIPSPLRAFINSSSIVLEVSVIILWKVLERSAQ